MRTEWLLAALAGLKSSDWLSVGVMIKQRGIRMHLGEVAGLLAGRVGVQTGAHVLNLHLQLSLVALLQVDRQIIQWCQVTI